MRISVKKSIIGLVVGIGLLILVLRYVDVSAVLSVLQANLGTPRGIILALLCGIAFLLAWCIRAIRWKLFLNQIGDVSYTKAIEIYQVSVFLNFLLPVQGGEVAKCFLLKKSTNIDMRKSLPTVALDRAFDLMPALFILVIVLLFGMHMDVMLWVVLGIVGGIFCILIFFIVLAVWKRDAAVFLLQKLIGFFPKIVAGRITEVAIGFIDSLVIGVSQTRIFIPAVLLTCAAIVCDGIFAMLAFWTIGFPIHFETALFGYVTYNMYHILPTPPGQIGSNEAVGLLVFSGLLHLPALQVTTMFVFSHLWAALLMSITGLACLSALGLKISSIMSVETG